MRLSASVCWPTPREAGDAAKALELLDEALHGREDGERWFEAELHRLRARLLAAGRWHEAEACFRRALGRRAGRAQAVGAACRDQPRPAVADQGKRNEARDLLAPVYGWFTEGFETPT